MINRENLIKIGRAGGNTSNRETPDQIGRVGMSVVVLYCAPQPNKSSRAMRNETVYISVRKR